MLLSYIFMIPLILGIVLVVAVLKIRHSHMGSNLLAMAVFTSTWLLCESLSFFVGPSFALFLQLVKYIPIVLISPTLLLLFYGFVFGFNDQRRSMAMALYIVPLLSMTSVLSGQFPYPFIGDAFVYFEDGVPLFNYTQEIGFYIHTFYSYSLLMAGNVMLIIGLIKSPKLYKNQSFVVVSGSLMSLAFNAIFIFGLLGNGLIDTSPIFTLFSLYVFYWAVYIMPTNSLVIKARGLVVQNHDDIIMILDNNMNIIDINPAAHEFFSQIFTESIASKFKDGDYTNASYEMVLSGLPISEEGKAILLQKASKVISMDLKGNQILLRFLRQDIIDEDHRTIGEVLFLRDVTASTHQLNKLITMNEALLISDTIINDAREGIIVLDQNSCIIKVNQSAEEMTGYSKEELVGNYYKMLRSDQHDILFYEEIWNAVLLNGFWEGEIWDQRKSGEVYPKWMSFTAIRNEEGKIHHYIIIQSDRTKLKKAESDLKHMAYYDGLTGLPNRTLFKDRLSTAVARANRKKNQLALLFIDLDRFKDINDTFGHAAGDYILVKVAERINEVIDQSDTLCRLAGDEFIIIAEDVEDQDYLEAIAQRIIKAISRPFSLHKNEVTVLVSIGIAMGPDDENEEDFLTKADMAMYQAKELGGSQYCFSSQALEKKRKQFYKMSLAMKHALEEKEFKLYLQPLIGYDGNQLKLVGAEALIRWQQEDGTMIAPGEFIHVAETNGMIHPIGLWVLEEIIRLNKVLRQNNLVLDLSINVSIRQFEKPDFISEVASILEKNETAINLTFEITESLFFKELDKGIEALKALKDLGLKIAMDDFGTGFSSLSYLNMLPIDYLKIDKSFVDEIQPDDRKNLAYMILSMAKTLDLTTVAEGVETENQLQSLLDHGCDIIQGFYFGKPVCLEAFLKDESLRNIRTQTEKTLA